MLYILLEPIYKESVWCKEIRDGIIFCAKEKRMEYEVTDSAENITTDNVIIVATSIDYIRESTAALENKGIKTVVATPKINTDKAIDSSFVGFDTEKVVFDIMSVFSGDEKNDVALLGVNEDSVNDILKKQNFILAGGKEKNVFLNCGNIKQCVEAFIKTADTKTAVLCTNCYVAFYLIKKLKEIEFPADKLNIVSLSDSPLLTSVSPSVSAVGIDYISLGKAAFQAYRIIEKNPDIRNLNLSVNYKLIERETTDLGGFDKIKDNEKGKETTTLDFYEDKKLLPIMNLERLLDGTDLTDKEILKKLLKGKKHEQICEELFMSESGLKYRLKKLFALAGVNDKTALLELIKDINV